MSASLTKAEIVTPNLDKGLGSDVKVLAGALSACGIEVGTRRPKGRFRDLLTEVALSSKARRVGLSRVPSTIAAASLRARRAFRQRPRQFVFLLENVNLADAITTDFSVFVPNPEWLLPESQWQIPLMDLIACKSRHAVAAFESRGFTPFFMGFTSRDRFSAQVVPDRRRFLNIASGGTHKGTAETVRVWQAHPEWPHLTVLAGRSQIDAADSANITIVREWISDEALERTMQECGVHVCCSNSEGFGHSIVESMSCGALVLATDAGPMNELVTPDRGLLVGTVSSREMRWGERVTLDEASLEASIQRAITMSDGEYARYRQAARAWYLSNTSAFHARVAELVALARGDSMASGATN